MTHPMSTCSSSMHGCEVLLRVAFLYARMLRDSTHAKSRPRFLRDFHITLTASSSRLLQSAVHTRRPCSSTLHIRCSAEAVISWWQSSASSPSELAGQDSSQHLAFQPLRQSTKLPRVRLPFNIPPQCSAELPLCHRQHFISYEVLCAAICRAAQTVISSQCKALFKEAVADSKTGNITVVPAIAILTEEEAEHPRPSSGWVSPPLQPNEYSCISECHLAGIATAGRWGLGQSSGMSSLMRALGACTGAAQPSATSLRMCASTDAHPHFCLSNNDCQWL